MQKYRDNKETKHIQSYPGFEGCAVRTVEDKKYLKCNVDPEEYEID